MREIAAPAEERLQILAPFLRRDQRAFLERIPRRKNLARRRFLRPRRVAFGVLAIDLGHDVERGDGELRIGVLAGLEIFLGVDAEPRERRVHRLRQDIASRGRRQRLCRFDDQGVGHDRGRPVALQQAEESLDGLAELFGPACAEHDDILASAPVIRIEHRVHRAAVRAGEVRVLVGVAAPVEARQQVVVEHVAQRDGGLFARRGVGEPGHQSRFHAQPFGERGAERFRRRPSRVVVGHENHRRPALADQRRRLADGLDGTECGRRFRVSSERCATDNEEAGDESHQQFRGAHEIVYFST